MTCSLSWFSQACFLYHMHNILICCSRVKDACQDQTVMVETQIAGLKCSVVSPTNTLLQLKSQKETTPASALLMHTKKCDISKAHFVASPAPSEVVSDIKRCAAGE